MKTCTRCHLSKPDSDFHTKSACRSCLNIASRIYREKKPEDILRWRRANYAKRSDLAKQKSRMKNAKLREWRKSWMIALKNHPCMDCRGWFPPECMDFDHRDPMEKSFCVSRMGDWSVAKVTAEMAKCDLICANCHRIRSVRAVLLKHSSRSQSHAG